MLAALPGADRQRLATQLEVVSFERDQRMFEPGDPLAHVWFPVDGVISITLPSRDDTVEITTVGNEGVIGVPVFLGASAAADRVFAQVAGHGLRMAAPAFRQAVLEDGPLRTMVERYVLAFVNQLARQVLCNRLHSIEERASRWLLMTQDRMGGGALPLTQEFLAQMLGVRRASVTVAAGILQKGGLISYRRGSIRILDRRGLEGAACDCYGIIRRAYEQALA